MHELTITEGISDTRFCDTCVRCFIDADFHYGYWVNQAVVEELLRERATCCWKNK